MGGEAMPVIEIIPKTGFYDYKNKYQAGLTEEICPAPISAEDTQRVQRLAERAFQALKLDAYGRADFLMDEKDGTLYCLELNSLPGMTPTSLIPQMAAAEGMSYGELCEKIIEVSREKYEND
jgi:D-alanine-D-alanine ligase and related ATP-grasp enzymes